MMTRPHVVNLDGELFGTPHPEINNRWQNDRTIDFLWFYNFILRRDIGNGHHLYVVGNRPTPSYRGDGYAWGYQ